MVVTMILGFEEKETIKNIEMSRKGAKKLLKKHPLKENGYFLGYRTSREFIIRKETKRGNRKYANLTLLEELAYAEELTEM